MSVLSSQTPGTDAVSLLDSLCWTHFAKLAEVSSHSTGTEGTNSQQLEIKAWELSNAEHAVMNDIHEFVNDEEPGKDGVAGQAQASLQYLSLLEGLRKSFKAEGLFNFMVRSARVADTQHEVMLRALEQHRIILDNSVQQALGHNFDAMFALNARLRRMQADLNKGLGESGNRRLNKPLPPKGLSNDRFAFDATLVFIGKESVLSKIPCRGQMDTGSKENWVSRKIIASTYLEFTIKELENPRAYRAFGGDIFFPLGQVDIQWYIEDDSQSRKTTFFVGDEVPFDMVVGSILIQEEDLLARKEAALGVRVVEPTEEELAQMETEANVGERSRQQLVAIQNARKARAAAERERQRRQQTAASATPGLSATSPGSVTPSNTTPST